MSVAVDIPFFVEFAANRSNRAIVHFEGMVAFLGDGASSIPAYATIGDPEDLYATGQAAVAAYGCMFWTMGWGSQLRTGIVQGTQGRWFVAEWRDMMHPNDYVNLTLESSTLLLAVSEAEPGTVYVHYETLSGSIDGSTGIVGAHGFGGVPNLLVADGVQGSVTNGMTIAYHFGTGTDPLNADTDGDDMPDEWEFAHGMNPLVDNRTDGNPRTNADADPMEWTTAGKSAMASTRWSTTARLSAQTTMQTPIPTATGLQMLRSVRGGQTQMAVIGTATEFPMDVTRTVTA